MPKRSIEIIISVVIVILIIFLSSGLNVSADIKGSKNNDQINYNLAWPGMLPDSRLYKVKLLRDKIMGKIISNPIKRIEFDLLMADKTIYASKLLFDKGEYNLAKETALKGEHYFTLLVTDYRNAFFASYKTPSSFDNKIKAAAKKHQQIFTQMMDKAEDKDKETYKTLISFSQKHTKDILSLKLRKANKTSNP